MSWVAEAKASSQKKAIEPCTQNGVGSVKATPASPPPIRTCMATIHQRLVLSTSTSGLQNGLMTQGR